MTARQPGDDADFVDVIDAVVGRIIATEDFDRVLAWLRESHLMDSVLPAAQATPEAMRAVSIMLARAIWDATPLPGNRFRPQPLPKPRRNDPCPCGSGLKYKRCCSNFPMPDIDPEEIWQLALSHLTNPQLRQALDARAVPPIALADLAHQQMEEGHPGKAKSLLEPLFEGDLQALDERYDPAVDALCDAYNQLNYVNKKRAFVVRLTREGSPAMRATAWQRMATIRMDVGDVAGAWDAFREAQRASPDQPNHAALEITLLTAQGRSQEARTRARSWRDKLAKNPRVPPEMLHFLDEVIADPDGAMLSARIDPQLERLADCIATGCERALPTYRLEADSDADTELSEAMRARLDDLGIDEGEIDDASAQMQLPLPETDLGSEPERETGDTADETDTDSHPSFTLGPDAAVELLESRWHDRFPLDKPFSVHSEASGDRDVWEPSVTRHWLQWLEGEPEALDSLGIIDDLVLALDEHPLADVPGFDQRCFEPLLKRGYAILEKALDGAPSDATLPWGWLDNRPALRLLIRYAHWLEAEHDSETAHTLLARYLALNPHDDHGVRGSHVNHLLRVGRNREALSVCNRFPDDFMVEIPLGAALAHYRLGEMDAAAQALADADTVNPHVIGMLCRPRVRQPAMNEYGVEIGGEDQAYLYRTEMRDLWAGEKGLLDWVRKQRR